MSGAVVAMLMGLVAPYALRLASRRLTSPRVILAGHVAGLLLAWAGVLAVVSHVIAPDTSIVGMCEVLLASLWNGSAANPMPLAAAAVYVLLPGRGLHAALRTWATVRSARSDYRKRGSRVDARLEVPDLGTVAVTVGILRPTVVVDPARLAGLTHEARTVVLAHERGHVRGCHPLIDLVARALAAGLAPWPGARVAHDEVRKHLEAAADDRATRVADPRTVARTIASVALAPPPAGLGVSGWTLWRVHRLLDPGRSPSRCWPLGALSALAAGVFGLQGTTHALVGAHVFPLLTMTCPA